LLENAERLVDRLRSDPLLVESLPRRVLLVRLRDARIEPLVDFKEMGLDGLELQSELLTDGVPYWVDPAFRCFCLLFAGDFLAVPYLRRFHLFGLVLACVFNFHRCSLLAVP